MIFHLPGSAVSRAQVARASLSHSDSPSAHLIGFVLMMMNGTDASELYGVRVKTTFRPDRVKLVVEHSYMGDVPSLFWSSPAAMDLGPLGQVSEAEYITTSSTRYSLHMAIS